MRLSYFNQLWQTLYFAYSYTFRLILSLEPIVVFALLFYVTAELLEWAFPVSDNNTVINLAHFSSSIISIFLGLVLKVSVIRNIVLKDSHYQVSSNDIFSPRNFSYLWTTLVVIFIVSIPWLVFASLFNLINPVKETGVLDFKLIASFAIPYFIYLRLSFVWVNVALDKGYQTYLSWKMMEGWVVLVILVDVFTDGLLWLLGDVMSYLITFHTYFLPYEFTVVAKIVVSVLGSVFSAILSASAISYIYLGVLRNISKKN